MYFQYIWSKAYSCQNLNSVTCTKISCEIKFPFLLSTTKEPTWREKFCSVRVALKLTGSWTILACTQNANYQQVNNANHDTTPLFEPHTKFQE